MPNVEKTDWDGLAQQLMTSMHGLRAGHGAHSKDMEMRGEINALHALHHQPEGMTPTALARACQVSTARITKTIDQLEGRSLVERHASPHDRRSVIVCLTDKGEAQGPATHRRHQRLRGGGPLRAGRVRRARAGAHFGSSGRGCHQARCRGRLSGRLPHGGGWCA